jgi:hypothetical protein
VLWDILQKCILQQYYGIAHVMVCAYLANSRGHLADSAVAAAAREAHRARAVAALRARAHIRESIASDNGRNGQSLQLLLANYTGIIKAKPKEKGLTSSLDISCGAYSSTLVPW